jgi:hypothetical protein
MNDLEKRYLDRFKRVRDFDAAHEGLFEPDSLARELFDINGGIVNKLESFAAAEAAGRGAARQGTVSKAVAKESILDDFGILRRTARSMSGGWPGIEEKFTIPHGQDGQELISTVRAALETAESNRQEFLRREVPPRVFTDLPANISAYEAALTDQNTGREGRLTAAVSIDEAIERGNDALRQLDPIVRNKLHNNPALLAAWLSAKRLERAPRRNNNTATPPTPQTPNT